MRPSTSPCNSPTVSDLRPGRRRVALPLPGRRRDRADRRLPARRQAGQEGGQALLPPRPKPREHPQSPDHRHRPAQELSRRAARDEARRRAVALHAAPARAVAEQPGRAGPPPDQGPRPTHARLPGLPDGAADPGRGGGDGDAGQGAGARRARERRAGAAGLRSPALRPRGLTERERAGTRPASVNATEPVLGRRTGRGCRRCHGKPSSSVASCAALKRTTPSAGEGQQNCPASNRLL